MNMFFKKKHDIDECNLESEQTSSVESCFTKKTKLQLTYKYDKGSLSFAICWIEYVDNLLLICLIFGINMSNESYSLTNLVNILKVNTLIYKTNSQDIF